MLGNAVEDGPVFGFLPPVCGTQMQFLVPDFNHNSEPVDGRPPPCSVCISVCLTLSFPHYFTFPNESFPKLIICIGHGFAKETECWDFQSWGSSSIDLLLLVRQTICYCYRYENTAKYVCARSWGLHALPLVLHNTQGVLLIHLQDKRADSEDNWLAQGQTVVVQVGFDSGLLVV